MSDVAHFPERPTKAPAGAVVGASGAAANTTQIVYTVPAGKTFYLSALTYDFSSNASVAQGAVKVRDAGDTDWLTLVALPTAGANRTSDVAGSLTLVPPLPIPAGYDVVVYSASTAVNTLAAIIGWLE